MWEKSMRNFIPQLPHKQLCSDHPPNQTEFRIPANPPQREEMIDKMMMGGLLRSELVQSLASREAANNQTNKEFMKLGSKPRAKNSKKSIRNGKHVINSQIKYEY
jgi:hypothetical protein